MIHGSPRRVVMPAPPVVPPANPTEASQRFAEPALQADDERLGVEGLAEGCSPAALRPINPSSRSQGWRC